MRGNRLINDLQGACQSTFPGVYDTVTRAIDQMSEKYFPGFQADSVKRVYGVTQFSDLAK